MSHKCKAVSRTSVVSTCLSNACHCKEESGPHPELTVPLLHFTSASQMETMFRCPIAHMGSPQTFTQCPASFKLQSTADIGTLWTERLQLAALLDMERTGG